MGQCLHVSVLSEVDSSRGRWICITAAHPQPLANFFLSGAATTGQCQSAWGTPGSPRMPGQWPGKPCFSCHECWLCWGHFYCHDSSQHCSLWQLLRRQKGGCPYGILPKVPQRLGRSLQMSLVGHFRADFISAKSIGILAFISRSRNKTLIPGNSVCITLYAVSQMCTGCCEKHGLICCCHLLCQNNGTGARVDLQEGSLGPLL